jgi:Protein of unknown function (DUF2537)
VKPVELRAERGRAVLVGAPELFQPPTALAGALQEWAEVAAAVCADDNADPATAELVSARGRQLAARLAAAAGITVGYSDPVRGVVEAVPASEVRPRLVQRTPPAEPTPWVTGLMVSAIFTAVTVVTVVAVVRALAAVSWWFGAVALVVITAGLAPSLWMARVFPVWRWVSYGAIAGVGVSWLALILASLGP